MNPYIIIAALLSVLAAGAGGFKLGADHELASQARADKIVTQAVDAANVASSKAIATLSPVFTTINQKVRHEVSTNTVFTDCRLPPVSVQLINQALSGGSVPLDGGKLPNADAPAR